MTHRAGFVNIIGNPNAGKSSLLNCLLGEKLAVITSKAQTTRHRILGMLNTDDYQIVFSDTPGILEPKYALQKSMRREFESALEDADIYLLVIDPAEGFDHPSILSHLRDSGIPCVVILNKIDLASQEAILAGIGEWQKLLPSAAVIPVSALHAFNIEAVLQHILEWLPEHPPYFNKEDLTDRSERFLTSEIIRACILEQYHREVPYSVEVVVEEFREEGHTLHIRAVIHVARETQKVILIGEGGKAIRRLGITSRKKIESFTGRHVFLELFVKVSRDWRDNELMLKRFGYQL
ncbi:MAG TPA: GTPase Era [Bacteroidales bacterium]|nr:GTPase Era [Bacteroidales bacterium]HSA44440.1 GTPase Era [Bacteroidales bacterium]